MRRFRGKEPGPASIAIENVMAAAETEHGRRQRLTSLVGMAAGRFGEEYGHEDAVTLLEMLLTHQRRLRDAK